MGKTCQQREDAATLGTFRQCSASILEETGNGRVTLNETGNGRVTLNEAMWEFDFSSNAEWVVGVLLAASVIVAIIA